jgi:hypothetical protein
LDGLCFISADSLGFTASGPWGKPWNPLRGCCFVVPLRFLA